VSSSINSRGSSDSNTNVVKSKTVVGSYTFLADLESIVSMGFDRELAKNALISCDGHIERAINRLVES
jgi:hypothetical protein